MAKVQKGVFGKAKQLMGALLRMRPKTHEEMKLSKPKMRRSKTRRPENR
jgi:hypothetical protein